MRPRDGNHRFQAADSPVGSEEPLSPGDPACLREPMGALLLRKPAGMTSFRSLSAVKRLFPGAKVGHTGTLDSFASGLLVVLVGKLTRLAPLIEAAEKSYTATAQLGTQTRTLDPEGEVVCRCPLPALADLEAARLHFTGDMLQEPPAYSAVKIRGQRAAKRVHSGETVQLPPRPVSVFELTILHYDAQTGLLHFRVRCSKGTYVRALARDWAAAAGSCAHLVQLERTAVGPFSLQEATPPEEVSSADLIPPAALFRSLPAVATLSVPADSRSALANGTPLSAFSWKSRLADGFNALFDQSQFLALVEKKDSGYRYVINRGGFPDDPC